MLYFYHGLEEQEIREPLRSCGDTRLELMEKWELIKMIINGPGADGEREVLIRSVLLSLVLLFLG